MNRILSLVSAVPLLAAVAAAQFEPNFGALAPIGGVPNGYGDDVLFDNLPMNITFPLGGLSPSYTHAQISSNGVIFLNTGTPTGGSTTGYPTSTVLRGVAGQPPRIAPMWTDLDNLVGNGGGVYFNNTIPGKFVVTWRNTAEWNVALPVFTVQAQLFANGDVIFAYSGNANTTVTVAFTAISAGNNVANTTMSQFASGPQSSPGKYIWEQHAPALFDLNGKAVTFTQPGAGISSTVQSVQLAENSPYGEGCYKISDSFYQFIANANGAPALNGQSMIMVYAGPSYLVTWGGGAYVPPGGGALPLALGDDTEVVVPLSVAMPTPSGTISQVYVHSNGMVSHASNDLIAPIDYLPDVTGFLNAPATGWFSWHDFNPTEVGSGQVKVEEVVSGGETILYLTWENVENYPDQVPNPSTLQFQLNETTGTVTIVWASMDGDASSPFGSAHLIGWGPTGPSVDAGNLDLSLATPFVTSTGNGPPITQNAVGAPISTPVSGSTVTFTVLDIPEFAPFSGLYGTLHVISFNQLNPGFDLGFLGAPGCNLYILTLDIQNLLVSLTPTASLPVAVPAGVPAGVEFYSQAVGLFTPNTLPNGQNAAGLSWSNGIRSVIAPF